MMRRATSTQQRVYKNRVRLCTLSHSCSANVQGTAVDEHLAVVALSLVDSPSPNEHHHHLDIAWTSMTLLCSSIQFLYYLQPDDGQMKNPYLC